MTVWKRLAHRHRHTNLSRNWDIVKEWGAGEWKTENGILREIF
jgi:hypothetical protein